MSKALHFKHEVPVTVRFSANTGIPKIADADPRAAPRGLAIRFRLPDGSDTDLVTHSYNGFPAKNPEEFEQFFLAMAGSKPGVPSPTPLEVFQETHPAAKTFLTTRDPPPMSYATTTYFGVNSFKFVNEKGAVTIGRYQLIPDAGRHFLSKDESAKAATNYLEDEIRQRVARGTVRFKVSPLFIRLEAQAAEGRMVIGTSTEGSVIFALAIFDQQVIDAGDPPSHQAIFVELPVLVAIATKPVAGIVVPFIAKRTAIRLGEMPRPP